MGPMMWRVVLRACVRWTGYQSSTFHPIPLSIIWKGLLLYIEISQFSETYPIPTTIYKFDTNWSGVSVLDLCQYMVRGSVCGRFGMMNVALSLVERVAAISRFWPG